jgi:hypothetical protein
LAISYGGSGGQGTLSNASTRIELGSGGGNSSTTTNTGGNGGGAGPVSGAAVQPQYGIKQGMLGYSNGQVNNAGNPGINGYGAGGGGAVSNTSLKTQFAGLNAGDGATNAVAAIAAVANFGGGGGGASHNGVTLRAGSNGGSGVCIIKYWSAF